MPTATTRPNEFVFVPAVSWNRGAYELGSHEAGHAVLAMLNGMRVQEVRIDRPDDVDGAAGQNAGELGEVVTHCRGVREEAVQRHEGGNGGEERQ